jgi:F420-dependent oxidoreductase-like protein
MSIRLGYQIPNFTYPDTTPAELFRAVAAQAKAAERSGFDTVFVMDHFYQLPGIGPAEHEMLECYTTLGGLASVTSTIQLSALVTGNTYRNPAMLAKTVTTLDVVSAGRAILGIGAGWFEKEHVGYGYEFGTFTDRFERLEEALDIIAPMLRGEHPTFDGKWYRSHEALNNPRVRDDLPIMLGGQGERKTFRLAALHAQHLNIICDREVLATKLEAVDARCSEVGRERSTLETSYLAFVFMAEDDASAKKMHRAALGGRGIDLERLDPRQAAQVTSRHFVGSPESVAAELKEAVIDKGVDGVIINMMVNGHHPEVVEMAGGALRGIVSV